MPFISNLAQFSGRKPCFQPTPKDDHQASWMNNQHLCWTNVLQQLAARFCGTGNFKILKITAPEIDNSAYYESNDACCQSEQ